MVKARCSSPMVVVMWPHGRKGEQLKSVLFVNNMYYTILNESISLT